MNLNIIYEDLSLIVCHKPAGLATETRRAGQQDMVSLLKNYRARRGEPPYVGLVHRLDQPVEGLLVFAKTQKAASHLSRQVRDGKLGKHYYAVGICGERPESGKDAGDKICLTDYLLFDKRNNTASVVPEKTPGAKRAVLDFSVVGQREGAACFDINLHTGRHHQIRAQMAHHGWPLVGDAKYGVPGEAGARLALCAYRLTFAHPDDNRAMDFSIRPENPVFAPFLRQRQELHEKHGGAGERGDGGEPHAF